MTSTIARRTLIRTAALAALVLPAAACNVNLVGPGDAPAEAEPAGEGEGDSEPSEETEPSEESEPDAPASALREELLATTTQVLAAGAGPLLIDDVGGIVQITGSAGTVEVAGAGVVVVADDVQTLLVSSTSAVVLVRSVQQVELTGTGCAVSWETGDPAVTDSGTGNTANPVAG